MVILFQFDICFAQLPLKEGSHIQGGRRPVVIMSNNNANKYSPVVTVVPLTSKLKKRSLPTHVTLLTSGLRTVSLALCEQLMALDKSRMTHYIGYVTDPDDQAALERAVAIQLGLVA